MVELGQAPVDEAQLLLLVVDHHVVRLHVAVNDALRRVLQQFFGGNG